MYLCCGIENMSDSKNNSCPSSSGAGLSVRIKLCTGVNKYIVGDFVTEPSKWSEYTSC